MKRKVQPWKFKVCAFILEYAYHLYPTKTWRMGEPRVDHDDTLLRVSGVNGSIDKDINLRTIWQHGKRKNFLTVERAIHGAVDDYNAAMEAKRETVIQ